LIEQPTHLKQWQMRTAALELRRQIVFGLAMALVLVTLGGAKAFFGINTNLVLWRGVLGLGLLSLAVALIVPSLLAIPEKWLRRVGGWVGHGIFLALLTVVYFLMIWPMGRWLRRHGAAPIYQWTNTPLPESERWQPKIVAVRANAGGGASPRLWLQPYHVISFFLRHKAYFLVPVLLVLIALGLTLFFVQTSVLAPFIYTLF